MQACNRQTQIIAKEKARDWLSACTAETNIQRAGAKVSYLRQQLPPWLECASSMLGMSHWVVEAMKVSHSVQPLTALQSEYSLWTRAPEKEVIPTLEELGIGFVLYSPLGRGFLTGKIEENANFDSSDFHSTLPRFTPEALKANQALINLLGSIAERKKATPAQIALAWLLAQKPWIVPIPGTTKLHRLEENIGAVSVELTPDDLRDIDTAASKITVQGARYPEKLEKMTGLGAFAGGDLDFPYFHHKHHNMLVRGHLQFQNKL